MGILHKIYKSVFDSEESIQDDSMNQKNLNLSSITTEILNSLTNFPSAESLFGGFNYSKASLDGYTYNYVIHKILDDISRMAANIPITVDGPAQVKNLIQMPSPNVGYKKFMKRMIIEKMLDGNAYSKITKIGKTIVRLDQVSPNQMSFDVGQLRAGECDSIVRYTHTCAYGSKDFIVEPSTGLVDVFHTKFFNPINEHDGLSPVVAAFKSLTQNNEISRIHTAILNNDGAVKGFIGMKRPTQDGFAPAPDKEQMKLIRKEMNEMLGRNNRGKWAVWSWLFDFVKLGQTGSEMDWNQNKKISAIEMCIALGYPAFLLGFPEGSTFNNIESAENWLVLNTVLPILEEVLSDLEVMIFMHTGQKVTIKPNREEIIAIQKLIREKRKAAREDKQAGVISLEECRVEGGYPREVDGQLFVPSNQLPLGIDGNDFTIQDNEKQNT